ncbi:MAG: hypothetical protein Q9227_004106 [Pyrenula ochraceoflavens]
MSDAQEVAVATPEIEDQAPRSSEKDGQNSCIDPASSPTAVTPQPSTIPNNTENTQRREAQEVIAADGDSEAETLIESPEKRKQPLDSEPKPNPAEESSSRDGGGAGAGYESPSGEGKSRKRKRSEVEKSDPITNVRGSSPRSSGLSSPDLASELAGDDHSDTASKRSVAISKASNSRAIERSERHSEEPEHDGDELSEAQLRIRSRKRRQSLGAASGHSAQDDSSHPRSKGKTNQVTAGSASERRETRSATYPRQSSHERSPSPQSSNRNHKRVNSTQAAQTTSASGAKKRRLPAPLVTGKRNRSEDRLSISTDNSGSPQPSAPHLRKLVSTENDAVSPAKMVGQHRKHRDQNGRTWLARACANDELEQARAYYDERPTDLNLADNAGNTPLQIASLSGFTNIVRFLLSKGCEVDTKNIDNDTPLIDAVENCHVDVIKLLLNSGANPRLGNGKGDEPSELVPEDAENYNQIRNLITNFKDKKSQRRQSDDQAMNAKDTSSRAASAASPRDSPPVLGPKSPPVSTLMSRRRTGRSESTRNDLLWQHHTQSNLTKLAAMGDLQGVVSVLNSLGKAGPDSVIAAARAGHDEVLSFLLGMGSPEADPEPVMSSEHGKGKNTPMLAAIGRGNNKVIRLLLQQDGFNPRRKFDGLSYPEISKRRNGQACDEEYNLLKEAYDNSRSPKSRKHLSPKKIREPERQTNRSRDSPSPTAPNRKLPRSPTTSARDRPLKQTLKRDQSGRKNLAPDPKTSTLQRASSGDHSIAVTSDYDSKTSTSQLKQNKTRRSHSDIPAPGSEGEGQRKRRLLSRKDHRELHSRKLDDSSSEEGKAKARVKSDPVSGKSLQKRPRTSVTPDRPKSRDSAVAREERKKRRIVGSSESPEQSKAQLVPRKQSKGGETEGPSGSIKQGREAKLSRDVKDSFRQDQPRKEEEALAFKNIKPTATLSEDKEMPDVKTEAEEDDRQQQLADIAATEADANAKAKAAEEARVKAQAEVEARARAEAEAKQRSMQREKEEADRIAREEEERHKREEAEVEAQRIKAEEEKRRQEEEEAAQKRAEEEAAQRRKEEEAAQRRKEEEERRERLRREEEERQERLRKEREERQRLIEERRQREAEEKERARREALPPLLGKHTELVDRNDPILRDPMWLKMNAPIRQARGGQIDSNCAPVDRDEAYITNFQAAILLATKDFNLTQYTQLERKPTTPLHRQLLFNTFKSVLWIDFVGSGPYLSPLEANRREGAVWPKFMALEPLFWVKYNDFKDLKPLHPHLKDLSLKEVFIAMRHLDLEMRPTSRQQDTNSNLELDASANVNPISHSGSPVVKNSASPIVNGVGNPNGVNGGYHDGS